MVVRLPKAATPKEAARNSTSATIERRSSRRRGGATRPGVGAVVLEDIGAPLSLATILSGAPDARQAVVLPARARYGGAGSASDQGCHQPGRQRRAAGDALLEVRRTHRE